MKPKQEDPKEMVGGCCVCADENGWTENPLVYCDGQGCNVAVHQACYGIVTVPTGAWFCRKCESQERSARVRCELCPGKDGALKRADSGGWAHVVCALYIPEVRFGNVTTMEPIMLQLIPPERFNKSCYICEEGGKASRATIGACMQCNKAGCKQHFHVICAQAMGLLCEEAGNYLDNVKYCGYCQYHYSKLRKGSHVKTIPPYRPVAFDAMSSDEDPTQSGQDSRDYKKKRFSKSSPNRELIKPLNKDVKNGEGAGSSKLLDTPDSQVHDSGNVTSSPPAVKNDVKSEQIHSDSSNVPISSTSTNAIFKHPPLSVKSNTTTTTTTSSSTSSYNSSTTLLPSSISSCLASSISSSIAHSSGLSGNIASSMGPPTTTSHSVAVLTSSQNNNSTTSITTHSLTFTSSSTSVTSLLSASSRVKTSDSSTTNTSSLHSIPLPNAEPGAEKDKLSKARRGGARTISVNSNYAESDSIHNSDEGSLVIAEERNLSAELKDKSETLNTQFTPNISATASRSDSNTSTDHSAGEGSKRPRSQERGRRSKRGSAAKRGRGSSSKEALVSKDGGGQDSGASSPESFTSEPPPPAKRIRTKKTEPTSGLPPPPPPPPPSSVVAKLDPTPVAPQASVPNGVGATTLLLGNQINPASAVAQKMADTLHAELEAHSIYKDEEKVTNTLIGPHFPGKREPLSSGAALGSIQPPPLPQSLEQLLERQWEQGSQFLMEQAQHFDIASLLSCLHQLRQENARLEETVNALSARRDHLLAVNARLSVPLTSTSQSSQSPPTVAVTSASNSKPHQVHPSSSTPASAPTGISSAATITPAVMGGHPSHPHPPHPHPPHSVTSQHSLGPATSVSISSRPHTQGRHPSGGVTSSANPISGRGTSPHDRRGGPHSQIPLPLENGLPEQEYRYRPVNSSDHPHRQHSPMLHPGMQANPGPMRQSPASSGYHSSSSPHSGIPSLSPSGGAAHAPPLMPTHGSHRDHPHSGMASSSHGPPSHSAHSRAPPADHSRAELVRLGPAQPLHSNPGVGYPVYQMVSPPVPGSHHSPVGISQHAQPHTQVMRREVVDPGRVSGVSLDKR